MLIARAPFDDADADIACHEALIAISLISLLRAFAIFTTPLRRCLFRCC